MLISSKVFKLPDSYKTNDLKKIIDNIRKTLTELRLFDNIIRDFAFLKKAKFQIFFREGLF